MIKKSSSAKLPTRRSGVAAKAAETQHFEAKALDDKACTKSTAGRSDRRLAEIVADKIRAEIIAKGWPVGQVFGSEADLLEKYKVSRSVLRQAVRLLEHHNVARMRPGPGSGLIITEPDSAATLNALSVFLEYRQVSDAHILETKRVIELACVQLAAERITPAGVTRLREALKKERVTFVDQAGVPTKNNLHLLIAELTENPALLLFASVLTSLSSKINTPAPPRVVKEVCDAHSYIVEAIIAGDVTLAMHAMHLHLDKQKLC